MLNLEVIQQRSKPKEPPRQPEKAPFFLPSTSGGAPALAGDPATGKDSGDDGGQSRITRFDRKRMEQAFTKKLQSGAASGNCKNFSFHFIL